MSISAIIITKNEETMLPGCLKSLGWIDEIIVVDSESEDKTVAIAKQRGAKTMSVPAGSDYSHSRNQGLKTATTDWIFYIDADERVPPKLRKEIQSVISANQQQISYRLPRKNIMLGKWLKYGGFWPDYVHRLFHKSVLVKWTGKLHESPTVRGEVSILKNPLRHYTARTIKSALTKSCHWSEVEAKLLQDANVPRVRCWKLIKVFNQKLSDVLILKKGILDGARGIILAYIQAFHQASILVNLWQLQQKK